MTDGSYDYDIVTVDWNKEQTKVWEAYIANFCVRSSYNLIKLQDNKPFSKIECGAKSLVFDAPFKTDKIIYLDTDTLVLRDLRPLFDISPKNTLGLTTNFSNAPFHTWDGKRKKRIDRLISFTKVPKATHYFNGMMIANEIPVNTLRKLGKAWNDALAICQKEDLLLEYRIIDEIALGCCIYNVLKDNEIWTIPLYIHANIAKTNKKSGPYPFVVGGYGVSIERPMDAWVLHYHSREFLEPFELQSLLNV